MAKPKILLIVDDWELLERYEESFSAHGAEVLCAPLGPEGIRIAREQLPHLVLLNLTFENMTNEEACLALRAESATRAIPIVAVGNGGPGPDQWIKWPVSAGEVLALVSSTLL